MWNMSGTENMSLFHICCNLCSSHNMHTKGKSRRWGVKCHGFILSKYLHVLRKEQGWALLVATTSGNWITLLPFTNLGAYNVKLEFVVSV